MTIDHVLASTCLPTLHHAVLIDGRATWDGGFAANPDLVTLAAESPVGDTLLVQLNPLEVGGVPRTVGQIAADMNRITFNQPLLRDVAEIVAVQKDRRRGWVPRRATRTDRVASHRFHVIEAGRHTAALPADSKLRPDRELIFGLHSAGREEAQHWLSMHRHAIGRASSVDLEARYLGPLLPGAGEATAEATAPDEPAPDARVATLGTSSN